MHDGATWQSALETNGWSDLFETGDEFKAFLESEQERVEQVLTDIGLT
jgi:putative tricarboxylic transport membrane protein